MTTTDPTTTTTDPAHDPAPIVLVAEVAISPEVLAKIERARQVLALSGLAELCQEVYESVTPVIEAMLEGASDDTFEAVSERSGWGPLYALVTDLAGALMVSVGAGMADLSLPEWIGEQDAIEREASTIVDMAARRPELFATMMAEVANDPGVVEELAKRGELRQRDRALAETVRRELEAEGLTHLAG